MAHWEMAAIGILALAGTAFAGSYVREHNYDTTTHPDDAAVNVSLVSNRWPDCTTLESAIESIFRLEGVAERTKTNDQSRALALWKWFRIMVSATGGAYAYEGPDGKDLVRDPHKIFTVYGHHQCDGMSWAMVPLWRAAGYMAFDECHNGHTIAALRYRDDDGQTRYHNLDPQGRFYYWDADHNRIGCWSMPVFTGHVFRHLMTPLNIHSLRTNLRIGETIERNWTNTGHVFPSGKGDQIEKMKSYYEYKPGRKDGVYAAVGEEFQTLIVEPQADTFQRQLHEGSANVACAPIQGFPPGEDGSKAALVAAKADREMVAAYRLPGPYVLIAGSVSVQMASAEDFKSLRVSISGDGGAWRRIPQPAEDRIRIFSEGALCRFPLSQPDEPNVRGVYDLRVKVQVPPKQDGRTPLKWLIIRGYRQLNKRTLPNIMPGENVYRVNADKLPDDYMLKLTMKYERNATSKPPATQPVERVFYIDKAPFYFKIDEKFELRRITNYDKDFNNEAVRMVGYSVALVSKKGEKPSVSLPATECEAKFKLPFPHPGDMTDRKIRTGPEQVESDIIQTNGFVPQSRVVVHDKAKMDELIEQIESTSDFKRFTLIQELGSYPEAVDYLLGLLPTESIDGTVYVVKALAQIGDAKAIDPLLDKWNSGVKRAMTSPPGTSECGAPGSRCIPDALAAIVESMEKSGSPKPAVDAVRAKAVAALLAPLPKMRFDFRFHIAHALGVVGRGSADAEAALKDLAEHDPFPPVREEARAALGRNEKKMKNEK